MGIVQVWTVGDCACGKVDFRSWVARPGEATRRCPECGAMRETYSHLERYVAYVPRTARKRFTPHFNTSFGCEVDSPEQLAHLQRVHGCEDADLSRSAADVIPSNFDTAEFLSKSGGGSNHLEAVDDDHLEARDEGLSIDDAAAHLGVA